MIELSSNSIVIMQKQSAGKRDHFVVQCSNLKVIEDCLRMEITDGMNKTKAIIFLSHPNLDLRNIGKPYGTPEDPKYLIEINAFTTYEQQQGKVYIQIMTFKPLQPRKPKNDFVTKTSIKRQEKTQERLVQTQKKQTFRNDVQSFKQQVQTQRIGDEDKDEEQMDQDELKNYQKISDLYTDMPGWQLIVRVLDKSYRQFNNKAGKLTKIFSMTLIDRTAMKIEGVMFGDNAKDFHQLIKIGGVYKMSRGQVRQDSFQQNTAQKHSRYNIVFNRGSIFVPLKEVSRIPRGTKQSNMEFSLLIEEQNFDKQFDVIGILLSFGEERTFQKGDRNIFKRSIMIGDPELLQSIEVVIWNKEMLLDRKWLNRTIRLKSFRIHKYKDVISLSSVFKSEIRLEHDHRFIQYEGKFQQSDYRPLSQGKEGERTDQKDREIKTIKQLQRQLTFSNTNEIIYSDFEVYISHMSFKNKWTYEACNNPKCKKSTEALTKCMNCGIYNNTTLKKFILPIEISDCTGSLWTTAFDQLAHQIFKGIPIDFLSNLSESGLKDESQKRIYQQYKMRISTKKQMEGNIKHSIVGKVVETNIERTAISNLERIKQMRDY